MGSLKRKSPEDPSEETGSSQKQLGEDGSVACVHDVSLPEGYVLSPAQPSASNVAEPAKKFPFTLDPFQSEAINCLEKGESVMVSSFGLYSVMDDPKPMGRLFSVFNCFENF